MKWIAFVAGGLVLLVAGIVIIGSMLPRTHKASRTLRLKRSPGDVWPVMMNAARASSVPVDILENDPPHRLVTRVTEAEKNFGGTWTIAIASVSDGSEVTIVEDGWVANPIFRFVSRFLIGHHATMDDLLKQVAIALHEDPVLLGE
jgi:hypothetical protein